MDGEEWSDVSSHVSPLSIAIDERLYDLWHDFPAPDPRFKVSVIEIVVDGGTRMACES
jgi:hypothetical protein